MNLSTLATYVIYFMSIKDPLLILKVVESEWVRRHPRQFRKDRIVFGFPFILWPIIDGFFSVDIPEILTSNFLDRASLWLCGKETTCQAGYAGSTPGLRRSPGIGMATHSSILAWESEGQRGLADYSPWGSQKSPTRLHSYRATNSLDQQFSNWGRKKMKPESKIVRNYLYMHLYEGSVCSFYQIIIGISNLREQNKIG